MSTVTYDGEAVQFQGAPPSNLGHLIDILRHTAANDGLVLVSVKVDGRDALSGHIDLNSTSYARVEAQTGTEKQLYLKAIEMVLSQLPTSDDALDPILNTLLSDTWETAFGQLNHFLQSLTSLFELFANLHHYAQAHNSPWKPQLEAHINGVNNVMATVLKHCETQQVAELVGTLNGEFRNIYTEALSFLRGPVHGQFVG